MNGGYVPPSGGGSAVAQTPQWTWAAGGGTPATGKFTTDTTNPNTTGLINFSGSVIPGSMLDNLFPGTFMVMVSPAGVPIPMLAASVTDISGGVQVAVSQISGAPTSWSGLYSVTFFPRELIGNGIVSANNGTQAIATAGVDYLAPNGNGSQLTGIVGVMADDSGWTANADGGDKTQSIPSSATLATIQTALNLAVAGAGDALFATAQKAKALETALNVNLLPNA